jgi:phosphopantetheinyl transferase (holo-ACP synthase)
MEPTAIYVGIVSTDGKTVMTSQDFANYLGQLLGRHVAPDDWVRLSSGQQARAGGWLAERGVGIPDLRNRLSTIFQPATLLNDAGTTNEPATTVAPRRLSLDAAPGSLGVGIDIQRVDELLPASAIFDPKTSTEVTAIFTLREISYAQSRPAPLETLGGLFAAKEALRKCDAALLALPLPEVEILPDASGRPQFPGFALSISHSGGFAIAVALKGTQAPPPAALEPTPHFDLSRPQRAASSAVKGFVLKATVVTLAILIGMLGLQWLGALRFAH